MRAAISQQGMDLYALLQPVVITEARINDSDKNAILTVHVCVATVTIISLDYNAKFRISKSKEY